ncbi:enkurin domain-containing protein 1 [Amia ocellicauda]|uniref:enkurin domain-containing protein 1 n=1 Tax=Amia ocellicauda TaxID=2972642 RepID=UPI003464C3B7
MCEGLSRISGPIPPDPSLFPELYRRPASARGRLEGNDMKLALLAGPLAPDPTLHPGCYSARAPPPPRVRPNATHILERGQRGVVGSLLQLEGIALDPGPPKHRKEVRDHGKENVRRLREIQRRCREREAERGGVAAGPVRALWRSPKYDTVPSKVMSQLQETTPPKKPECQNFLKAHSRCGSAGPPPRRPPSCPASPRRPSMQMVVRGRSVDFVRHNALAAFRGRSRSCDPAERQRRERERAPSPSQPRGVVPQYLQERKQQWRQEEEEKRRSAPDPSVPPGHTQLPEVERQETLNSLKETQRSLVRELLSLPVRADTLSMQSRRAELDRKLSEVEEAIKVFSRPKVYIRVDS